MIDNTIQFFKEIAKIPRESGNEEKIADYLCDFAQNRKLEYVRDEWNNVLIRKKNINRPAIILQAHTDMVCEKIPEKDFNFKTDSIKIVEENGYLRADGTTLGADNGIGVAQILNILDTDIPCNIEAILTTSEETSMIGAINFDVTQLKGKQLLNLDGFEENTIIVESACFYDIVIKSNYEFKKKIDKEKEQFYQIEIIGLPGGHSGFEIDKNRGNSCIEIAKILKNIRNYKLSNLIGGTKFNVIPSSAFVQFSTNISFNAIQKTCNKTEQELRAKYPDAEIKLKLLNNIDEVIGEKESKEFIQAILEFPHGVLYKNEKNEVTTSINLGVVNLKENEIKVGMRSSRKKEEVTTLSIIKKYCKNKNFQINLLGSQPGFESDKDGSLINELIKTQPTKLFKEPVKLKAMHIAVEVGFFQEKIPGLQIAIISPNIQGAHTANEKVEISSIYKTNEWIYNFLKSYFSEHKKKSRT